MRPQSTTEQLPEEWRPVVGYEGWYEVSNLGSVRRIKVSRGAHRRCVLQTALASTGYPQVHLYRDGRFTRRYIHRLVAEIFLEPCPPRHQVNHRNGVKADNRAVNLEWVTSSGNQRHAYALGLKTSAGTAKLTFAEVKIIRSKRGMMTERALGQEFGVTSSAIGKILRRRNWKYA